MKEVKLKRIAVACVALFLGSCGAESNSAESNSADANGQAGQVESSGKVATPLSEVPSDVVAAARAAQPDLQIASAEAETRDGRRYYDLAGTRPDGSEFELDIVEEDGRWRVVETQRDVDFTSTPQAVQNAAQEVDPSITPSRVVESRQEDGVVIYEIYSPQGGDPQVRKLEVRWDGNQASVLTEEWTH